MSKQLSTTPDDQETLRKRIEFTSKIGNIIWMVSLSTWSLLKNYEWSPDSRVFFAIWVAALLHHVTTSAISIVYHRSETHGAIELNETFKTIADNLIQFGAWFNVDEWKPTHEMHHLHADEAKDPHSPKNGGLPLAIADPFMRYNRHVEAMKEEWTIDAKLTNTPIQKLLFLVLTANGYIWAFWDTNALIAIATSYFLLKWASTTVNGLGHNHPERRREFGKSHAQNVWVKVWKLKNIWLNFLTAGEHTHGNHHFRPKSADISLGWKDGAFDVGFFYIKILERLGLAKIRTTFDSEGRLIENK